eukprot:scaffold51333_cov27-Tisochrysis_lutea.AAC.1
MLALRRAAPRSAAARRGRPRDKGSSSGARACGDAAGGSPNPASFSSAKGSSAQASPSSERNPPLRAAGRFAGRSAERLSGPAERAEPLLTLPPCSRPGLSSHAESLASSSSAGGGSSRSSLLSRSALGSTLCRPAAPRSPCLTARALERPPALSSPAAKPSSSSPTPGSCSIPLALLHLSAFLSSVVLHGRCVPLGAVRRVKESSKGKSVTSFDLSS